MEKITQIAQDLETALGQVSFFDDFAIKFTSDPTYINPAENQNEIWIISLSSKDIDSNTFSFNTNVSFQVSAYWAPGGDFSNDHTITALETKEQLRTATLQIYREYISLQGEGSLNVCDAWEEIEAVCEVLFHTDRTIHSVLNIGLGLEE